MANIFSGSKVAIVAPSAQIGDISKIKKGLDYLKTLGANPILYPHVYEQNRYMAGSDKDRATDINNSFANPEIKAVFCVRAAAGATRILPYIDYKMIAENKKPMIGFCDNAALQMALFTKSGLTSLNGFLLTYDFRSETLDKIVQESLEKELQQELFEIKSGEKVISGSAEGQLVCCNLTTLLYLAGNPYFPNLSGKILLVEDVHERLHRIDLKLQQLKQLKGFNDLSGIILGQFTDCSGDEEDGTLEDCFQDFIVEVKCPVIKNFCFGHTPSRYVLPLGAKVKLDADNCLLKILHY